MHETDRQPDSSVQPENKQGERPKEGLAVALSIAPESESALIFDSQLLQRAETRVQARNQAWARYDEIMKHLDTFLTNPQTPEEHIALYIFQNGEILAQTIIRKFSDRDKPVPALEIVKFLMDKLVIPALKIDNKGMSETKLARPLRIQEINARDSEAVKNLLWEVVHAMFFSPRALLDRIDGEGSHGDVDLEPPKPATLSEVLEAVAPGDTHLQEAMQAELVRLGMTVASGETVAGDLGPDDFRYLVNEVAPYLQEPKDGLKVYKDSNGDVTHIVLDPTTILGKIAAFQKAPADRRQEVAKLAVSIILLIYAGIAWYGIYKDFGNLVQLIMPALLTVLGGYGVGKANAFNPDKTAVQKKFLMGQPECEGVTRLVEVMALTARCRRSLELAQATGTARGGQNVMLEKGQEILAEGVSMLLDEVRTRALSAAREIAAELEEHRTPELVEAMARADVECATLE